ncbi:sensor histidine kinase [Agaribacterium haliotis]|uniref:sensor histidine kinase n=1 Tax=Agaribacterium haliotis TaxID=2013869 RepID=UPI0013041880|nr:ATP-binding protein [Agaribacterium haliotis]
MQNSPAPRRDFSQQALQVYLYYRLVLAALLVGMHFSGVAGEVLGALSSVLYSQVSLAYLAMVCLSLLLRPSHSTKYSPYFLHLFFITDIAALFLLIHASKGIESGLPYLLIVSVAMSSMFVRAQVAYAYAALISIGLLLEAWLLQDYDKNPTKTIFTSGLLGLVAFIVSFTLSHVSTKLRQESAESEERNRQIKNLQFIAQNIITRMQTGIIVVDAAKRIELMNSSAKLLLGLDNTQTEYGSLIADYKEIAPLLNDWQRLLEEKSSTVIRSVSGAQLKLSASHLDENEQGKTIFYLEDYGSFLQQAQQLKLASLGRLAASIAHEIRNPLGAMSHAAQLLNESDELPKSERRLTEIILNNSVRVNDIIENTLNLSRRREPKPEQINLATWLPHFINDHQAHRQGAINLHVHSSSLLTKFDPTHLSQILSNLVDNGLRYSQKQTGEARIELEAGVAHNDERAYIEVIDYGKGIDDEKLNEIFEPFYTTDSQGSGLGLYISRELAQINNANLHYRRNANKLSCFRIDFSHYQRMR